MSFQPEGFSKQIFEQRYAIPGETWDDFCIRVSSYIAMAENDKKKKYYTDEFYKVLIDNKFVAGGRINYGAGRHGQLLNCFTGSGDMDSREGWAKTAYDMIKISMTGGGLGLDFSDVRPNGSSIGNNGGTCPGPVSLMELINNVGDPVRSGGGRRVALMFSLDLDHPDIERFLNYKLKEGKLDLANVSVRCKDVTKFVKAIKSDGEWELKYKGKSYGVIPAKKLWDTITKNAYKCAEPGFLNWELANKDNNIFYETELYTTNPCLPAFTKVVTRKGLQDFGDVKIGDKIWSSEGWTTIINKWSTGIKKVYKYHTTAGSFIGTEDHKIVSRGEKVEVKNATTLDILNGPELCCNDWSYQTMMDGLMIGDGSIHLTSKEKVYLTIGQDDQDYFKNHIKDYINERHAVKYNAWKVKTTVTVDELPLLPVREIPERFIKANPLIVASFLRGLYSANGSICGNRITLKSASFKLIEQVQLMLSSIGIKSCYTTNKASKIKWTNGEYVSKQSYDLNISVGRCKFRDNIGFIQGYKNKKLDHIIECTKITSKPRKCSHEIRKVEYLGEFEVFDITVDNNLHTFWNNGINISNCGEITLPEYGSCDLGHVVLSRFVDEEGNVDWHDLGNTVRLGVRFLDDVLTVNKYPLPEIKIKAENERRIGLGTTGLGDYLILRGLKYGSEEALKEIDKLYRFISKAAYEASVMLAIEKGSFPWFKADKFLESGYMKRQTKKVRALVKEHGIRNCALLTNAPTGTVSIMSGNCSSGLEPIFAPAYERRYWSEDKREKEIVIHPLFKLFYEAGKPLESFVSCKDLTVRQHLEVQAIVQKHIDQAVSKSCNIPYDYPVEDLSEVWLEFLPKLKGTTFYRESTRGYYNKETGKTEAPPLKALTIEEAKKVLDEKSKVDVGVQEVNDCPKGVCTV